MKKFTYLMMIAFMALGFYSCEETDPPTPEVKAEIKFAEGQKPTAIVLSTATTETVNFKSTEAWTALSDADWCTVPTGGEATDTQITLTVTANETHDERVATITLKSDDAEVTFILVQKQKDAFIVAGQPIESFPSTGGVFEITVFEITASANTPTVEIKDADKAWVKSEIVPSSKVLTVTTFKITIEANTTPAERSSIITVKSGDKSKPFTVTQSGAILIESITFEATMRLEIDGEATITPVILPATATNKELTWTSTDATIAEVVNGVVTAKKAGTATITATAKDGSGKKDDCIVTVVVPMNIAQYDRDKGEAGKANRANSYIIPLENNSHKLSIERIDDYWAGTDALYGGNNSANTIASNSDLKAVVIWSDFDYADKVSISADATDKSMLVTTNGLSTLGGNMVVAVTKLDGTTILWSWHLWFSDVDVTVSTELPSGQKIMDRNLGAKSIDGSGVETYGLLYQWGRKDPTTGSKGINAENSEMGDEYTLYTPAGSGVCMTEGFGSKERNTGSIASSIANPFTLYIGTHDDWVKTGVDAEATNSKRWNNSADGLGKGTKTIFDPCPFGWRMSWGADWTGFTETNFLHVTTTPTAGHQYNNNPNAFLPAAGHRMAWSGLVFYSTTNAYYWSGSSVDAANAYFMQTYHATITANRSDGRCNSMSVRPVQDI